MKKTTTLNLRVNPDVKRRADAIETLDTFPEHKMKFFNMISQA